MVFLLSLNYGLLKFDEYLSYIPFFFIFIDQPCQQYNKLTYKIIENIINLSEGDNQNLKTQIQLLPPELREKTEYYFLNEDKLSPLARLIKRLLLSIRNDDLEMFKFFLRKYYYNPYEFLPEALIYLKNHNFETSKIKNFLDQEIERLKLFKQINQKYKLIHQREEIQNRLRSQEIIEFRLELEQQIDIINQNLTQLDQEEQLIKQSEESFSSNCLGIKYDDWPKLISKKKKFLLQSHMRKDPDYQGYQFQYVIIQGNLQRRLIRKPKIIYIDPIIESIYQATILYLKGEINYHDYKAINPEFFNTPIVITLIFNLALEYDNLDLLKETMDNYSKLDNFEIEILKKWIADISLVKLIFVGAFNIYKYCLDYLLNHRSVDQIVEILKEYLNRHFPTPWGFYDINRFMENTSYRTQGHWIDSTMRYNILKMIPLPFQIVYFINNGYKIVVPLRKITDEPIKNINMSPEIISDLLILSSKSNLKKDDRYKFNGILAGYCLLSIYYGDSRNLHQNLDIMFKLFDVNHKILIRQDSYSELYYTRINGNRDAIYLYFDMVLTKLHIYRQNGDDKASKILEYIDSHKIVTKYQYRFTLNF